MIQRFELNPSENEEIQDNLRELAGRYGSAENPEFLDDAALYAQELPRRLRAAVHSFKLHEPDEACLIVSGYGVDPAKIGLTPEDWRVRSEAPTTTEEEMYLVLLGMLVGEPIAWSTQQDGRLVHDIFPMKGKEKEQLGMGSETLLWWHVEDAFHPLRGDYLGMMCLRNPDKIATTFATLDVTALDPRHVDLLFQPLYTIRPDESHLKKNSGDSSRAETELQEEYGAIERMSQEPEKIAVLFGDRSSPYLRLDPYFMDRIEDHPEAQEALDALVSLIDGRLADLVLDAGDVCLIDNFKAVHGRKPFKARYDGQDRWLKRINVTRDLRKSRGIRRSAADRVIH